MERENMEATLPQPNPMCGGDGPHSYVRNSSYQKAAIDCAKAKVKEAIFEKIDLSSMYSGSGAFKVADFGCSIGPNTFDVIQNIVETVKLKYHRENNEKNDKHIEFQAFCNDQSNNDFNILFKNLSISRCRQYFAAGVPGSFYDRLFPRNTIHIGHTSYTLHWLSKVPRDVCDTRSPSWNRDNIICTDLVEEVSKAYKVQFNKDMGTFLRARAQELVHGGLMIMSGMCLPDDVPMVETKEGVYSKLIGDCLIDMAKLGLLSEEKVGSFSLPVYFPHKSELKEVIERNGSFSIEVMERVIHPMENMPLSNSYVVSQYRAIFHGVIEEYFGDGVVDELFDRYAKKLDTCSINFTKCKNVMQYFIVLKKNIHRDVAQNLVIVLS